MRNFIADKRMKRTLRRNMFLVGKDEGKKEGMDAIIRNMPALNTDMDFIVKVTGKNEEHIRSPNGHAAH
jgi:hypothetical protein